MKSEKLTAPLILSSVPLCSLVRVFCPDEHLYEIYPERFREAGYPHNRAIRLRLAILLPAVMAGSDLPVAETHHARP